jgi:hypothetical protein
MKHESINRSEREKEEPPVKLDKEEVQKILKEFKDARINADEHPEYFSIHLKNGNIVRIPKWEHIFYKDGSNKTIRKEIRDVLNAEK